MVGGDPEPAAPQQLSSSPAETGARRTPARRGSIATGIAAALAGQVPPAAAWLLSL
jgi:hypothetical protein